MKTKLHPLVLKTKVELK